jgi:hypothetical protein
MPSALSWVIDFMADLLLKNGCTENPVQKTDGAFFRSYLNSPPVED